MADDLSQLIAQLADSHAANRAQAAEKLAKMGPDARAAAVPLTRLAADPDESVREWSVAALEELGPPSVDDVAALAAGLAEAPAETIYWLATLLGRLEDQAAPAVLPLAKVVTGVGDIASRQRAAWALGEIGPGAAAAMPALEQAKTSDDPRLARLAGKALDKIRS